VNIVTSYPTINLNTANVYTEVARRDNQNRELIPQAKELTAISPEARLLADTEKAKIPGQSVIDNHDALQADATKDETINAKEGRENESDDGSAQDDETSEQQQAKQATQQELDQAELEQLNQLKSRDQEVRAHEQAHASVGGSLAGAPDYEYEKGPDGSRYAVAGEVPIDVSEVPNNPQATIDKMQQVQAAALAPAEPSSQDRAVAAQAAQKLTEATAELLRQQNADPAEEDKSSDKSVSSDDKTTETEQSAKGNSSDKQAEFKSVLEQTTKQRAPEIEQRAERIANHYFSAVAPYQPAQFVQNV
jgi:hypothetical protein